MIFILVRRHVTFICRLGCSTFGKQICLLRRVDRQYSISRGIWQATPCSSVMGFPIKNFENRLGLIFDKVKAFNTNCAIFWATLYSVASAVDSDCSRTAPEHCYGSTQQQREVSKRLPTADHPRNYAASNDVRV